MDQQEQQEAIQKEHLQISAMLQQLAQCDLLILPVQGQISNSFPRNPTCPAVLFYFTTSTLPSEQEGDRAEKPRQTRDVTAKQCYSIPGR